MPLNKPDSHTAVAATPKTWVKSGDFSRPFYSSIPMTILRHHVTYTSNQQEMIHFWGYDHDEICIYFENARQQDATALIARCQQSGLATDNASYNKQLSSVLTNDKNYLIRFLNWLCTQVDVDKKTKQDMLQSLSLAAIPQREDFLASIKKRLAVEAFADILSEVKKIDDDDLLHDIAVYCEDKGWINYAFDCYRAIPADNANYAHANTQAAQWVWRMLAQFELRAQDQRDIFNVLKNMLRSHQKLYDFIADMDVFAAEQPAQFEKFVFACNLLVLELRLNAPDIAEHQAFIDNFCQRLLLNTYETATFLATRVNAHTMVSWLMVHYEIVQQRDQLLQQNTQQAIKISALEREKTVLTQRLAEQASAPASAAHDAVPDDAGAPHGENLVQLKRKRSGSPSDMAATLFHAAKRQSLRPTSPPPPTDLTNLTNLTR